MRTLFQYRRSAHHLLVFAAALIAIVLAGVGQAHAQRWTVAKTADRTAYTAVGQTINYTYTVTNLTGDPYHDVKIVDDLLGTVCSGGAIAANGTLVCNKSYTTVAADLNKSAITNTATVTGLDPDNISLPVISTSRTVSNGANGSITIIKNASGGNGTFTFTSTVSGTASFTLTTTNGTASRSFSNLSIGTYKFTETDLPLHWKLSALSCTGDNGGTATTVDLSGGSVSIGLDGGESITCTFTNTFEEETHREQTQQVIRRFLTHRMSLLLSEEPDRPRFLRRVPGSLWTGDSAGNAAPFNFAGTSSGFGSQMTFSTSLRQIVRANAKAARAEDDKDALPSSALAYAKPKLPFRAKPGLAPDPDFDVWLEAHYLRFRSRLGSVDNDGNFGVLYLGTDRLITPSALLGVLVQIDWTTEASAAIGSSVSGTGAMAGPYISVRLAPNLFFDARGAWGLSSNDIDPFGSYTDNFSTDRWLAHAKLTGNWHWGDFRLTPSAALDYIQEHQREYTDSLGVTIPGQTLSLGRLSFGPEIARRFVGADGTTYEPMAALTAQWDFDRPDVASLAGQPISAQAFHAQAQAGLMVHQPNGIAMRVVATYNGIGDDTLQAYGGQFWLNLPIR